jgi:SHS2 domain-containing protein
MPWRELPHTADLRLEITAPDWPGLVVEATLAFAAHLGRPDRAGPTVTRPLAVQGIDREELLVHWLTETLVWCESEGLLAVGVRLERAIDEELRGEMTLAPAAELGAGVKAVTYHELAVAVGPAGWSVRIVFDL